MSALWARSDGDGSRVAASRGRTSSAAALRARVASSNMNKSSHDPQFCTWQRRLCAL